MRRMWMLPGSWENSIVWKIKCKTTKERLHSYILIYAVEIILKLYDASKTQISALGSKYCLG